MATLPPQATYVCIVETSVLTVAPEATFGYAPVTPYTEMCWVVVEGAAPNVTANVAVVPDGTANQNSLALTMPSEP